MFYSSFRTWKAMKMVGPASMLLATAAWIHPSPPGSNTKNTNNRPPLTDIAQNENKQSLHYFQFFFPNDRGLGRTARLTTTRCEAAELDIAEDGKVATAAAAPLDNSPFNLMDSSNGRLDVGYEQIPAPPRALVSTHAIFGALLRDNLIERYEVYRIVPAPPRQAAPVDASSFTSSLQEAISTTTTAPSTTTTDSAPNIQPEQDPTRRQRDCDIATAIVQFGNGVDGHRGVVHGGILALVMDDVLGFAYQALPQSPALAMTANLNVNYVAPVPAGTTVLVHAQHVVPFPDQVHPRKLHWNVTVTSTDRSMVYCRASSLFIIPR